MNFVLFSRNTSLFLSHRHHALGHRSGFLPLSAAGKPCLNCAPALEADRVSLQAVSMPAAFLLVFLPIALLCPDSPTPILIVLFF